MAVLNEPHGWKAEQTAEDWTPTQGLWRGATAGAVLAVLLALLSGVVAVLAPPVALNLYVRAAGALLITLVLLACVQRAAGMAGWPCTGLAVGLAVLVLLSHHVCFAVFGVGTSEGVLRGAAWLSPGTLLMVNYLAIVGVGFGAVLGHRGSALIDTAVDILMTNPLTGTRH